LKLLAPDAPSPAATAVMVPDGIDGSGLVRYLRDRMGVTFAGGQDKLKGRIVRLSHLGYVDSFDVVTGVAALELALHHFGASVSFGRGVGRGAGDSGRRAASARLMAYRVLLSDSLGPRASLA
jgi:aspartate aminotransferase-like enzyme